MHQVLSAGADWLHVDCFDGHFVPNLTIGPPVAASLRKALGEGPTLDCHLCVTNPEDYVESMAKVRGVSRGVGNGSRARRRGRATIPAMTSRQGVLSAVLAAWCICQGAGVCLCAYGYGHLAIGRDTKNFATRI